MRKREKTLKLCTQCGPWRGPQPMKYFDKDNRTKDGHRSLCKACRREQRYAKLAPASSQAPSLGQRAKFLAKRSPFNARSKWAAFGHGLCLVLLFIGGFGWSTLNGSFAFFNTARLLSATDPVLVAVVAASVLTLGTATAATWTARLWQRRKLSSAAVLLGFFMALQGFNLVVNLSGVKNRLQLAEMRQAEQQHQGYITKLQQMKTDYQQIIERYALINKDGKPVVWRPEITSTVKGAYEEIKRINREIMLNEDKMANLKPESAWYLLMSWLILPELCMLTPILVFSLRSPKSSEMDYTLQRRGF